MTDLLDPPRSFDPQAWRAFYAELAEAGVPEEEWPLPEWLPLPEYNEPVAKRNTKHDRLGRFAGRGGGLSGNPSVSSPKAPAINRSQATGTPVAKLPITQLHGTRAFSGAQVLTRKTLTKDETGKLGEQLVASYLGGNVRSLNIGRNNYPVDLRAGTQLIESKAGQVNNKPDSMKWRATIGEPGGAEKTWQATLSPADKFAHNQKKLRDIIRRKYDAVAKVSNVLGRAFKPKTYATIINPDTKTFDIFEFDGFHREIRWNSPAMAAAYKGTFKYKGRK